MATRGRPPRPRPQIPMASAGPLSPTELAALSQKVMGLACVKKLPANQQVFLLARLADDLTAFKLITDLNKIRRTGPGNKPKAHLSLLLYKCGLSWCHTNNLPQTSLWEALGNKNAAAESPAVELARACVEIATGKPYPTSLRQQFEGAKKWSTLPTGN